MGSPETGPDSGRGGCSFFGSPVPHGFQVQRVVVDCGAERAYDEAEWLDAIVLVEEGEIELECIRGGRHRFGRGDMLWLVGLPLRALRCAGTEPAVLIAVSRPATDEFSVPPPSERHRPSETLNGMPTNHEPKGTR